MEQILEQIGLTPTEAKVYLSLLELGEAKTGEILQKAKLNSGRIYEVLNALEQKGLVSTMTKGKVKRFMPAPPQRILDLLEQQHAEIEKRRKQLAVALPALAEKYKQTKQQVNVEAFFGTEGQRTAYGIFFKQTTTDKQLRVYGIVAKENYPKGVVDLLQYYVYKERKRLGLHTKKIAAEEARNDAFYRQDKHSIRFLPYPTMTSFQVFGDMTFIEYAREPVISILIHSKEIAEDYRKHFDFLWKVAKP